MITQMLSALPGPFGSRPELAAYGAMWPELRNAAVRRRRYHGCKQLLLAVREAESDVASLAMFSFPSLASYALSTRKDST